MVRAATGRGAEDVGRTYPILLSLFGIADPSPEQHAGAAIVALGLADLHALVRLMGGK
jgi:hypothetical protein